MMKHKIKYFDRFVFVLIPMIITAILVYNLSFAMLRVINAAMAQEWTLFWNESLWMMIFVVLLVPSNLLTAYCRTAFSKYALTRMKSDYLEAVFGKNIDEFQKDNNAAYVSALTNDFSIIETDYIEQIVGIAEGIINFSTAIIIYSMINPLILLVGIGMMVVNGLLSNLIERPVKKHNRERSELFAGYNSFIKEVLSAFGIIKNNGLETRVRTNFNTKSESVQQKKYIIDKLMSFVFVAQNALGMSVFLVLMLFVVKMTLSGAITFAAVVVIVNNIDKLIGPIFTVAEAIPKVRSVKAIFTRIEKSLQDKNTHVETLNLSSFEHEITFKNVSFAYEENQVLKNVDLTFEKGKKYLIIGPSGGGKSTVLRLLRKYFEPSEGTIEIDGSLLSDIKKQDYFARIANIEQMIFLFEDTLRNNLTLFKDYDDAEISEAIAKAGLTEFVQSNSEGLDYMIYDNGKNVSGGEKSRIAIARALLNKSDIIMLDEAFASLDRNRVKAIEATLMALDGVMIINVSHVVIAENKDLYDGIVQVKNKSAFMINR
ncbi:MAG: ABC transporter ATP-binding protein [Candidatus Izemoplasmatales bacterium]|jgi:ATP-binding cassette subfamily C protein|nr:ABC transporter ATP-binding protein [Candidatus Izemoplasmatales bacterium]MDD3865662.1 ABC transporter ATP-binding protein [Candidatus Izemoplasmatales bacterium]